MSGFWFVFCPILRNTPHGDSDSACLDLSFFYKLDTETPLTGTATVHHSQAAFQQRKGKKHPSRGQRRCMFCRHFGQHKHKKHLSRGRAAYFLLRFADFCGAPRRALAKNGARRQTRLAVSSTGRASACLPLTGTHLPSLIHHGRGLFCAQKTAAPALKPGLSLGAQKIFKKWRNLFNPAPPAAL